MMIYDNHSHTVFSSDSEMQLEEALTAAKSQGIGLVFTEHYDYDYMLSKHYKDMSFRFDAHEYWDTYAPFRGKNLRLGVEVSLSEVTKEANQAFLQEVPFDLVIGSIHMLDMLDLYYPDYYEGKTKPEILKPYFAMMAKMLRENPYIDVLGHIDYICRYLSFANKELEYDVYHEEIDEVLRAAVETDTVLELNTRRLGDRLALKSLLPIYQRYRELGGKYISLGSDAHVAQNIGMNFAVAQDMLDFLKLKPVTFCERKME